MTDVPEDIYSKANDFYTRLREKDLPHDLCKNCLGVK